MAAGETPKEVVQLSQQLKLVRGRLDNKSDLCDQLAEELHRLEEQLGLKERDCSEARALHGAVGAELRAAARAHAADRSEREAEVLSLRKRTGSLRDEAQAARERGDRATQQLEELQSRAARAEAEGGKWASERAQEMARLRRLLSTEEAACVHGVEERRRLAAEVQAARKQAAKQAERAASVEKSRGDEETQPGRPRNHRAEQALLEGEEAAALRRARAAAAEEIGAARSSEEACRAELRTRERSHEALEASLRSEAETLREAAAQAASFGEELRVCREESTFWEASAIRHRAASGLAADDLHAEASEAARLAARLATEERVRGLSDLGGATTRARLQELQAQVQEMEAQVGGLRRAVAEAEGREAAERGRADHLERMLRYEREMHQEALCLLEQHRIEKQQEDEELGKEIEQLSSELEEKESDMMTIQFDMVELQNRLSDQSRAIAANQEELEAGRSQLEEKDDKLRAALARQEELMNQVNEVTEQLQEKVAQLSRELEGSRSSYHSLEVKSREVRERLEADRASLMDELSRARAQAATEADGLREAHRQREAEIEDGRLRLAEELRAERAEAERGAERLRVALRHQEESAAEAARAAEEALHQAGAAFEERWQAASMGTERAVEFEEKLKESEQRMEALMADLRRSRLIERQAVERAQELRAQLAVLREFGTDDFMQGAVPSKTNAPGDTAADGEAEIEAAKELDRQMGSAVPDVLVAVELDLGFKSATLSVAPWHTPDDFSDVVGEFLREHDVRPVFAEALVAYLKEVEEQAPSFPVFKKEELSEVFSKYG